MNDWKENTGTQPVPNNVKVEVIFRVDDKSGLGGHRAGKLCWEFLDDDSDIIKWREYVGE